MASVINTNIASLNAQRNLSNSQSALNTSIQRLSTGLRINSAKDDAAGLAIAERFSTQINGLNQAVRNANDGISLAQTAEGALSTIGNNLQRIRTLAVQSRNATNSTVDRGALQKEVNQLVSEIQRVAKDTSFNGTKLLDGSFSAQTFQVGANRGEVISIDSIANAQTSALGQFNGVNATNLSIGGASDTATPQNINFGGINVDLGNIATDAKAITNAINASGTAGLTATANETKVAGVTTVVTTSTAGTAHFTLNGTTINLNATESGASNRADALAAINAQSATTGVVATDTGSGISLTATDGRNITTSALTLGTAVATTFADFGLGLAALGGTHGASINVTYQNSGKEANSSITGSLASLNAFSLGATGTSLDAIDITTELGADDALTALDAALSTISSARADLGAIQNRFTSVVSNLQVTSENLSASRSRILDTDFAEETANLTRGQILQQAGTAMLAQANSLPNTVLTLLQG